MLSALHSLNVQSDLVGDPCYVFAVGGSAFAGFDGYEKELTKDGRDGKLSKYDKFVATFLVPILTLIVILNCFGFIK